MHSEFVIMLSVVVSLFATIASGYFYFFHYRKVSAENIQLRERIEGINEKVERRVKERTKDLENMRDSISNFAVKRFELAQELEQKNTSILEQRDITEKQSEKLREAYEEIKRLESFRHQMVQMMIHDLKNPLNVILNMTDTEAIPTSPRNIIRQISYEMLDLILNLLEVQKFKEMKMKVENESIHLNSLLKNLTDKLRLLFTSSSIELRTSIPPSCWINADRHIVNRILSNILSNAIKYTPVGGVIQIFADQKDQEILFEIRDNGNGIHESQISSLFEMYKQGENFEPIYNSSTGIGLTYCKLAVEALGGKIGIKSEFGNGTEVWFTLRKGNGTDDVDQNVTSEGIEIKIQGVDLTMDDIKEIKPFIADLKLISIYEISEVLSVTKKIDCIDNSRIMRWKESVEETVFSANERRYRELIDIT
jgi:signal transduction histidine kinase